MYVNKKNATVDVVKYWLDFDDQKLWTRKQEILHVSGMRINFSCTRAVEGNLNFKLKCETLRWLHLPCTYLVACLLCDAGE